jgi:hypothetical protein
MSFIRLDVDVDFDELLAEAYERIATLFPGWVPNEASLEAVILAEKTRMTREAALVAVVVGEGIFREFGQKVIGVEAIDGARATHEIEITATDNLGYTLPAGFTYAYRLTGDDLIAFRTTEIATIPPGSTSVTGIAGEAVLLGADANGFASGSSFEPVDTYAWIESIESTTASSGGEEAETDSEYLDRLRERLTLLADRPILPEDFAVLTRSVAGVHRARALDGYNPDDDTWNNERMISIGALDENGVAVGAGVKTEIETYLEEKRETTFDVRVIDPTLTIVNVVFTAVALPGYDAATVEADAETAVTDYLDPANWGGGDEDPPTWRDEDIVRYLEVAAVLDRVEGLDIVTALTLAKNGGAAAAADVTLDGPLPLPRKVEGGGSTVAGTVTAP